MQRAFRPRRWTRPQVEFVLSQFASGMQAKDIAELFNARFSPTTITKTQVRTIRWTYRDVDNRPSDAPQAVKNPNHRTVQAATRDVSCVPQVPYQPSHSNEFMNCPTLYTSLSAALVHAAATDNLTITVEEDLKLHGNRIGIPYNPSHILVDSQAGRVAAKEKLEQRNQGNLENALQEQANQPAHQPRSQLYSENRAQPYSLQSYQSYGEQHCQPYINQASQPYYDQPTQHYSDSPDHQYNGQQYQHCNTPPPQHYNSRAMLHSTQVHEPDHQGCQGRSYEQADEPYQNRAHQTLHPSRLNYSPYGNHFHAQQYHGHRGPFPPAPVSIPMNVDGGRITDAGAMGDLNYAAQVPQHGNGTVAESYHGGFIPDEGLIQHETFASTSWDSAYGQMPEPVLDPSLFDDFEENA